MSLSVVILAAGLSTRFKSATPKVLHPIGGKPLLGYSLDLAQKLTPTPPVIVVGPETEAEIRAWAGERAQLVVQQARLGTGHALMQAETALKDCAEHILVLYGDMPLLQEATLQRMIEQHTEAAATLTLMTVRRDNPQGFGRIVRDDAGNVQAIVEEAEATPAIAAIRELNVGIYLFDAAYLWSHLSRLTPSPRKGEYYLTDLISMAVAEQLPIASLRADNVEETLGINTRVDLALAAQALQRRINTHWMLAGVTLEDPDTTYIAPDVMIGGDTIILPNTHLRGQTSIGAACEIGPNTVIEDCTIGDRCRVTASFLEQAIMEDDSNIGPFGHLRKGAKLCRGAHMGNFGEMKNSTLGPGAKMGHFSYLGDATIGAEANIGAGTITCNYDGQRKHPTVVEAGAFIGSDTMLVAPVHIGAGAKTGAGAVVTSDIPPHSVAYGVPARVRRSLTPPTTNPEEEDRGEH